MSEEMPPPTPRLRPRPPPSDAVGAAAPEASSANPPAPALFIDPPVPAAPPAPAVISEPAPGPEKLRLRSTVPSAAAAGSPPPFPLMASDAASPQTAPSLPGPAGLPPAAVAGASVPPRSYRVWVLLVGLLLLGGVSFLVLRSYFFPPLAAPSAATPAPAPADKGVAPLPKPAVPASAPVSTVPASPSPSPGPQTSAPASVPNTPSPGVTGTSIAPGVVATIDLEVTGNPSPTFRAFVAKAAIRGVIGGQSPKALINGKVVHVGDFADSTLGITLAGIDAPGQTLLFRDSTGATVTRRY